MDIEEEGQDDYLKLMNDFLLTSLIFFYPAFITKILHINDAYRYYFYILGFLLYGMLYFFQKFRSKSYQITGFQNS